MKKYCLINIGFFFLFGCQVSLSDGCNKERIKKFHNKEGKLVMQNFYPNGKIKIEAEFKNDSIQDGRYKRFYENGILESEGYYKDNDQYGEWKFYYENRNIKSYVFFNDKGKQYYLRKYDENGKLIKSMGIGLIEGVMNDDKVKAGEIYQCDITVVNPPDCTVRLFTGEYIEEQDTVMNLRPVKVNSTLVDYSTTFIKPGKHNVYFRWEVRDNITGKVESGDGWVPITVY